MLLALLPLGAPVPAVELSGRLASAGGHQLWISCAGAGSPTVVIDVGIGGDPREWTRVVDDLRADVRVCQYERGAYGASEPGPFPRDAKREGEELLALLRNAGEKPPYLLAGQGLGALNAYVLAGSHANLLAGLALFAPPPLAWLAGDGWQGVRDRAPMETAHLRNVAKKLAASSLEADKNRAPRFLAMASENESLFSSSAKQAAAVKSLGALPLLVVGAALPNPILGADAVPFQKYTVEENRKLAAKSSHGEFVLFDDSGPMVHHDAPARVVESLRALLRRLRAGERKTP
jgi:pimeloyl-ACP methyl ester carboxylesterase